MPDVIRTAAPDRNNHRWRFFVCDKLGSPISELTTIADNVVYTDNLSRPATLSMEVDASDPRVNGTWADGFKKVSYINRVIKAFRREKIDIGGGTLDWRYVIKFAGFIWPMSDHGDTDENVSSFTAYDPMHLLTYRLARASDGSVGKVTFTTAQASQILKTLVDRTNAQTNGMTGLTTAGGVFGTTNTGTVEWHYKMINEAMAEIIMAPSEVWVTPQDSTTGAHGILNCDVRRGSFKPNLVMGWADDPYNLDEVERTFDAADAANVVVGLGANENLITIAEDATNQANYLRLEAVQTFSDTADQTHLNDLVGQELLKRKPPQEALTFKPGIELEWGVDFQVGDSGTVLVGPALRGGFGARTERIYGMSLTVTGEDDEDVSFVTTPE